MQGTLGPLRSPRPRAARTTAALLPPRSPNGGRERCGLARGHETVANGGRRLRDGPRPIAPPPRPHHANVGPRALEADSVRAWSLPRSNLRQRNATARRQGRRCPAIAHHRPAPSRGTVSRLPTPRGLPGPSLAMYRLRCAEGATAALAEPCSYPSGRARASSRSTEPQTERTAAAPRSRRRR